jgi:lysozyme
MTAGFSPELFADVQRDEGLRLRAYPDPLSPLALACLKAKIDFTRRYDALPGWRKLSGEPWTIGYGSTKGVKQGDVWTLEHALEALAEDLSSHCAAALTKWPWLVNLDPVRRNVILNMAFNMGVKRLSAFVNTLAALKARDYAACADGMADSLWAKQTGDRAERLIKQMRTGKR